MGFSLKRIHPRTTLYFEKVLDYKVHEYTHINQVAQEMRGGAVICLIIWKSAFLREKLHSAQAVSGSLVRSPLASGMWICLKKMSEILTQVLINL